MWSLGIFLIANEREITSFFRNKREGQSVSGINGGRAAPPKVEQVRQTTRDFNFRM